MQKQQCKRRGRYKRKVQRLCAMTLVFLAELLVSAIPSGLAAAVLLPMGLKARGGFAIGAEWLVIALLYCATYTAVHFWLCNKLFEEE